MLATNPSQSAEILSIQEIILSIYIRMYLIDRWHILFKLQIRE